MYKIILISIISITIAFSQVSVSTDSLGVLINDSKHQILDEVIYEDPLRNKTIGIMFNPIAPIIYDQGLRIYGGFSYFPKGKQNELYLGYQYINDDDSKNYRLDIDILNRFYFSRKYRKGFHLLYGTRFSHRKTKYSDEVYDEMLGLSFGVGYRIFSKNGLYWGTSLYVGRHLLSGDSDENDPYLFMELLKIGYLFK